jgi:hypothetical protein
MYAQNWLTNHTQIVSRTRTNMTTLSLDEHIHKVEVVLTSLAHSQLARTSHAEISAAVAPASEGGLVPASGAVFRAHGRATYA